MLRLRLACESSILSGPASLASSAERETALGSRSLRIQAVGIEPDCHFPEVRPLRVVNSVIGVLGCGYV